MILGSIPLDNLPCAGCHGWVRALGLENECVRGKMIFNKVTRWVAEGRFIKLDCESSFLEDLFKGPAVVTAREASALVQMRQFAAHSDAPKIDRLWVSGLGSLDHHAFFFLCSRCEADAAIESRVKRDTLFVHWDLEAKRALREADEHETGIESRMKLARGARERAERAREHAEKAKAL